MAMRLKGRTTMNARHATALVVLCIASSQAACGGAKPFLLDRAMETSAHGTGEVGVGAATVTRKNVVTGVGGEDSSLGPYAAQALNRDIGATEGAAGITTAVDIVERVDDAFGVHSFTFEIASTLPDGSVVRTRSEETNVATGGETALRWGLAACAVTCLAPVTILGAIIGAGGDVGIIPIVGSLALAVPGLGLVCAAPALNDHTEDRSQRASDAFRAALREHAGRLAPALAQTQVVANRARAAPAAAQPQVSGSASSNAPVRWYYRVDDERVGPVLAQELGELLARRVLPADVLVWHEGMAQWLPAKDVPELAARIPSQ
jgi:hypothetical protein